MGGMVAGELGCIATLYQEFGFTKSTGRHRLVWYECVGTTFSDQMCRLWSEEKFYMW